MPYVVDYFTVQPSVWSLSDGDSFGRAHFIRTSSPQRASVGRRRTAEGSLECFREARFRLIADAVHRFGDRQAFRLQKLRCTKDAASRQVAHRRFANAQGEALSKVGS